MKQRSTVLLKDLVAETMTLLLFPITEEAVHDRITVLTQRLFLSNDQITEVIKYIP
jgi:hypothetical protein